MDASWPWIPVLRWGPSDDISGPLSEPRVSRVSSVGRDLRALGSSAPLRAAYEASKRSNFHAVLFNSGRRSTTHVSVPLALGTHAAAGAATRERCLADA